MPSPGHEREAQPLRRDALVLGGEVDALPQVIGHRRDSAEQRTRLNRADGCRITGTELDTYRAPETAQARGHRVLRMPVEILDGVANLDPGGTVEADLHRPPALERVAERQRGQRPVGLVRRHVRRLARLPSHDAETVERRILRERRERHNHVLACDPNWPHHEVARALIVREKGLLVRRTDLVQDPPETLVAGLQFRRDGLDVVHATRVK